MERDCHCAAKERAPLSCTTKIPKDNPTCYAFAADRQTKGCKAKVGGTAPREGSPDYSEILEALPRQALVPESATYHHADSSR